ncbi:MAG: hypothetical protein AB1298_06720 [Bacteroidota bacterium]
MKGVYLIKRSPFYWLRYYDKHEQNTSRKRKSINTKIEVTEADKKRHAEGKKLIGTSKLRNLINSFRSGLAQRNIELSSGVKFQFDKLLSEGYAEFKEIRTVPGSKKEIKKKTIINYDIAVKHMIAACGDKKIYKYSGEKDYVALLHYLDKIRVPGKTIIHQDGKKEATFKKMSVNSKSIYTRSLRSLWNFFCEKTTHQKTSSNPLKAKKPNPTLSHLMKCG